jgi:hypothetical protein
MKRTAVYVLMLSAGLASCPPAWASWSSFISTGNATGIGNPSCAFVPSGKAVCAVRNGKSEIMVNEFNGSSWGTWTNLAGAVASNPSCTSNGAGDVICAATATSGKLLAAVFNGSTWTTPVQVTAQLYSAPSCAELTPGMVLCAARSVSGGLAYSIYNGASWNPFKTVATSAVSAPGCATDNAGGVVCAVVTTDGVTLVNRYTAGAWEGFLNLGGSAAGDPNCSSVNSGGKVACFAEAYNSGMIYGTEFLGGSWLITNWTTYGALGGAVSNNANCTTQAAGLAICGAIGELDNAFYADVYNGSSWGGWLKIGGTGIGIPACGALGTAQVVCIIMGVNNKLTSVVGP